MGRSATISIQNDTGQALAYAGSSVQHGKFDLAPPQSIAAGAIGTFRVANHPGSLIGPEGSVTYQVGGGSPVELSFYWNVPHGGATPAYSVGSTPPWYARYTLTPPTPSGDDEALLFTVSLNPEGFDPRSWMAQVGSASGGKVALRTMVLPGAHDAGSYGIEYKAPVALDYEEKWIPVLANFDLAQGWARAQGWPVYDQLCAGVRYLDLRVSNGFYVTTPEYEQEIIFIGPDEPIPVVNGKELPNVVRQEMRICHALASVEPSVVIGDVARFLDENPDEIVLLNFQHFYGMGEADYEALLGQLQDALGSRLMPRPESTDMSGITLADFWAGDSRVIVFFDKDHVVVSSGKPDANFIDFAARYPSLYDASPQVWSAAAYLANDWLDGDSLTRQRDDIAGYLASGGAATDQFFVLQCVVTPSDHMYKDVGSYPGSLKQLGMIASPYLLGYVQNHWAGYPLNVVLLDWIVPSIVTQLAFELNQRQPPPSIHGAG